MTINYEVSRTHLFLQDEHINLDEITELEDASIFKLEEKSSISYEKDYKTQMDIVI